MTYGRNYKQPRKPSATLTDQKRRQQAQAVAHQAREHWLLTHKDATPEEIESAMARISRETGT